MKLMTENITGRKVVTAYINERFWQRASLADKNQIRNILTDTSYNSPSVSGRSLVSVLKGPYQVDNTVISSIRFKGVAPNILADGSIPEHRGQGYVRTPIEVKYDGTVSLASPTMGAPEGGILAKRAEREFQTAAALGPQITNYALGYGIYPELEYSGQRLGFVFYGQEDNESLRFMQDFIRPKLKELEPESGPISSSVMAKYLGGSELYTICHMFGENLALFHRLYVHQYPHLGNIIVIMQNGAPVKIKICDLDACLPIKELEPAQAYSYLFLDLARVFYDFCTNWAEHPKEGSSSFRYNLAHLLPSFLKGYFGDQMSFNINNDYYIPIDYDLPLTDEQKTVCLIGEKVDRVRGGRAVNFYQLFSDYSDSFSSFIALMHRHFSGFLGLPCQP